MSNKNFAEQHRVGSSIYKAFKEGITYDEKTGKAFVKGKALALSPAQRAGLIMAALQQTFSVRDTIAAFTSFENGYIDRITEGKQEQKTVRLPKSIDELSIETVLSILDRKKVSNVPLTVEKQIGLGIYSYTAEDNRLLQAEVDRIQESAKWLELISEYFGITDCELVEQEQDSMTFACSRSIARFQRSYKQVLASKDRGWYIDPRGATPDDSLENMLFTLTLDLKEFYAAKILDSDTE